MTKEQEELLNEAKRRYSIGTKFKSAFNSDRIGVICGNFWIQNNDEVFTGTLKKSGEAIFYYQKWAEIISKPNLNNYYFY